MTDTLNRSTSLDEFDHKIGEDNMIGQWTYEPLLHAAIGGPKPRGTGAVWPWTTAKKRLLEASEILGPSGAGRVNLTFLNPGFNQGVRGSTNTISAGVQMMRAQEACFSHRHSMSALRFVIDGNPEAYTVVDGERLTMDTFDLVLTPRMAWHDHHNPTDSEVFWLDVLDLGLTLSINQGFYEEFGESFQPERADFADSQALRMKALRPTWERTRTSRLPVRYAWSEVLAVLEGYGDAVGDPFDGLALSYANPVDGGPTMSTMDCWIQQLAPGFRGERHRRTSSNVGYVISGHATIEVEGESFEVGPGDTYAVPNYAWHSLSNSGDEPARIFSVHDIPAVEALGLFYEEPRRDRHASFAPAVPGIPAEQTYRIDAMLPEDEAR